MAKLDVPNDGPPAPYLHEFVTKSDELVKKMLANGHTLSELSADDSEIDADKLTKYVGDVKSFEESMKLLLKKSFDYHDANKDGVLETDEAESFFAHVVTEHLMSILSFLQLQKVASLAALEKMARKKGGEEMKTLVAKKSELGICRTTTNAPRGMDEKDRMTFGDALEKEDLKELNGIAQRFYQKNVVEETKKAFQSASMQSVKEYKGYRKNSKERNAAAFKLMDKNGDGRIQIEEFMECIMSDGLCIGQPLLDALLKPAPKAASWLSCFPECACLASLKALA